MKIEVERQLDIIAARSVDLVSREELRLKVQGALQARRPLRVKYGADPSAPDIHLGHVVGLNKLREFQDLGHTVVFIIGDFTGMIGDPSGRSDTRKPLTRETVEANARTYRDQVFRVLNPERTEIRMNSEWCAGMTFEDVLRLSSRVTVARMLAREDFQQRFSANQPISLVEFMYPLIQGYDSVKIEADIELGGTDQLFNLLVGRDLQKSFGQEPQVALTLPLLEGLDGVRKMSKSLGNYVGLNDPPREMFGKLMSMPDALMGRYFSLVLGLPEPDFRPLLAAVEKGERNPRELKDELARRITERFYGAEEAAAASAEFRRVFSQGRLPDDIPAVVIPAADRKQGKLWIVGLLVTAGLAPSNGAARRLIQQGAVTVGGNKVTDAQAELEIADGTVVQAGKRGFARITSA